MKKTKPKKPPIRLLRSQELLRQQLNSLEKDQESKYPEIDLDPEAEEGQLPILGSGMAR